MTRRVRVPSTLELTDVSCVVTCVTCQDDDVRKYVIGRKYQNKKGQDVVKRPKIQRLVTPLTLQVNPF